jgi:Raf kinase inhibitor-like YbhB/YbcL family protein
MELSSPAFADGEEIPREHTSEGRDLSPALDWTGVPEGTKSFALLVEDPDALSKPTWVHWLVVDLPGEMRHLSAGADVDGKHSGLNDWKHLHWDGPSPPSGRHRYVFTLYALDQALHLRHPYAPEVQRAMRGHVLAEAKLTGTYQRHA